MAHNKFWFGLLIIVLVFGMMVFGCSNGTTNEEKPGSQSLFEDPVLVISQISSGSGKDGAPFKNQYIELYNSSAQAIDLSNYVLQYALATGAFNTGTYKHDLAGSVSSHDYYRIKLGSEGSTGSDVPGFIDWNIIIEQTDGKLALVKKSTYLTTSMPNLSALKVVDFVGWGTTNIYLGSGPAPGMTPIESLHRKNGGDFTGDNNNDFILAAPVLH